MNILAVDTSTSVLNIALQTENGFFEYNEDNNASQHSELLMPKILEICKEGQIDLSDLNLLVCTRGPGSFTGLRIGMSCLKGLSLGLNIPLVSVSTLNTYASAILQNSDCKILSELDAKKQKYYLAVYEKSGQFLKQITEEFDGNAEDLKDVFKDCSAPVFVTGPENTSFISKLNDCFKDSVLFALPQATKSFGKTLIDLGIRQYETNGADDIGQGPVYIRKSDAEIALEERMNNK